MFLILASCTNGGTNQWTPVNDKHSLGGLDQISVQTLDACKDICIATTGCNAIDYKNTTTGTKCWIFINEPSTPQLVTETGVIHATLEKCVPPTSSKLIVLLTLHRYGYIYVTQCTEVTMIT